MAVGTGMPIGCTRGMRRSALPRRFCELTVFDARLHIRVGRVDQRAERGVIRSHSRPQLYMAHELAGALQQVGRIRQRCALKKAYVYMRFEDIDVPEGR